MAIRWRSFRQKLTVNTGAPFAPVFFEIPSRVFVGIASVKIASNVWSGNMWSYSGRCDILYSILSYRTKNRTVRKLTPKLSWARNRADLLISVGISSSEQLIGGLLHSGGCRGEQIRSWPPNENMKTLTWWWSRCKWKTSKKQMFDWTKFGWMNRHFLIS